MPLYPVNKTPHYKNSVFYFLISLVSIYHTPIIREGEGICKWWKY